MYFKQFQLNSKNIEQVKCFATNFNKIYNFFIKNKCIFV